MHSSDRPEDPYRRWAELTEWEGLKPGGLWPESLSFMVERVPGSTDWNDLRPFLRTVGASVPFAYDVKMANGKVAGFATLRLSTRRGEEAKSIEARVRKIVAHPKVARLQLGYPRGASHKTKKSPPPLPKGSSKEAEVVIGVIDYGCPFAHPALLDQETGLPRVALLWQQTTRDDASSPWCGPVEFEHGRVLDNQAMVDLMALETHAGEVDESRVYQSAFATKESKPKTTLTWCKPSRILMSRASHGASILGLVAAPVRWAYMIPDPESCSHRPYGTPSLTASQEAATKCPLLVVDMPREQVEISSGRWMPINALDGVRFIANESRRLYHRPDHKTLPVVINLSSGAMGGAHAGEAMFERALDELLCADDHLTVVLAAGNGREVDAHAELYVEAGGTASVGLFVPPAQLFDTCVELWLPAGADLKSVTVTVTSPSGSLLEVKGPGETKYDTSTNDGLVEAPCRAALIFYSSVVQATGRTMALLAISGTAITTDRRHVPEAGPWKISVSNGGSMPLTVAAWIERDDIVYGVRRDQVARFFSLNPLRLRAADERPHAHPISTSNTLSNIATGAATLAVGAFRGRSTRLGQAGQVLADGPVADYSGRPAEPPNHERRSYLPFAAVADAGKSHPGIRAIGNRGDALRRMNGTSAAAPQATRFIANEMAQGKSRSAIVRDLPPEPAPVSERMPPDPADGRRRL